MKIRFKYLLLVTVILLLNLCSCSDLKLTSEMQASIDKYLAAVTNAANRQEGRAVITTVAEDNAIEFKTTESIIDCEYKINDGKVTFSRTDYLNGQENAKYTSDGQTVQAFDFETQSWVDKTEENKAFLSADTNPITSLSLFRVDNNNKVKTNYLSNITEKTEGEYTVVTFHLKDSTVSTVLGYSKADGIVRTSAGHTRSYYINSKGELCKIVIEALQDVVNNGETGTYKSTITVEIS